MNKRKILLFLLIAFVLSWSIGGIIYLLHIDIKSITAVFLLVGYMYMPALSALLVQKYIYKEAMIKPLRISFRLNIYFLWALLIPLILVLVATGIGFLFKSVTYTPDMSGMFELYKNKLSPEDLAKIQDSIKTLPINPIWIVIGQGLIAAVTVNALAAFGEELGWRGFLLSELKTLSYFKASLVIGIIWGLWHAPIILMGHNYAEHPQWGVLFMIIFCTLYTFLLVYMTLKAKSVIAASVMHGSINAFFGITIMLSSGGTDLSNGIAGAAGFITLALAIVLLFIYDKWISNDCLMARTIGESID